MHLGVCEALKKLEPHLAITSCDSYTSFMVSNLLHVSVTGQTCANDEPVINGLLLLNLKGIHLRCKPLLNK